MNKFFVSLFYLSLFSAAWTSKVDGSQGGGEFQKEVVEQEHVVVEYPKPSVGNMAPQNDCCAGTCCDSASEDCCPDPDQGGICCIIESSFCCPPGAGFYSRCCPRWMVCCTGGRFGCCDPAKKKTASDDTAYALFDDANFDGTMALYGLTIDTSSASKTQQQVSGFNDYGESTRVFLFDPKAILFYLLRANFSKPGFDGTEPITLYIVDPVKGTTTSVLVTGATGLVTGMEYNPHFQMIQFATYKWVNKVQVGYNFYVIDPKGEGVAKLVSTYEYGAKDNWIGWFREISADGKTLYRLGYKDVVQSIDRGIGLTDISTNPATTQWIDNITIPNGLDFYLSVNVNGGDFYSLAEDSNGALNLVQWNISGTTNVIANLGDAYNTRYFGPIAESLNLDGSVYYAMVIDRGIIPIETDRWALSAVDLQSGQAQTTPISPWMIAGTDGLSGFGIAYPIP